MANWSDPRTRLDTPRFGAGARSGGYVAPAFDAGMRSYMLRVYNYMTSGVLLTGVVALLFAAGGRSSYAAQVFLTPGPLKYVVMFAPLLVVLGMSFGQSRMQTTTLKALFWAYAVLMGLSLSTILLVYTGTSVAGAFFASAAGFAGLSLYGYSTKRDLSPFGTFLIVGVIGLVVAMLVSIWVPALNPVISIVGVLLFAGLTAYDTQRTKSMYAFARGSGDADRMVVFAALQLYLDFINMFLFVLRLFGNQRG